MKLLYNFNSSERDEEKQYAKRYFVVYFTGPN